MTNNEIVHVKSTDDTKNLE